MPAVELGKQQLAALDIGPRVARMLALPLQQFPFGRREVEAVHEPVAALQRGGIPVCGRGQGEEHNQHGAEERSHGTSCTSSHGAGKSRAWETGK
jgi:hypothetical protein